jgi:uncharacterized membrane protein
MMQLLFAALFFLGLHFGIAGTVLRMRLIERLGERTYRIVFSSFSLLGLFWLAHAYRAAGYVETWGQLAWFKPIAAVLMLAAFLFAVLGLTTPNPTAVIGEKLLENDVPVVGVMRITRHPFLWGLAIWAFTHLVANGDAASLVLFGSLLVLVLGGMPSIDAKRKKTYGAHWERFAATTSVIPFMAIKEGRNRLEWKEIKPWQLAMALVAYAAIMHFHKAWFGVSPLL